MTFCIFTIITVLTKLANHEVNYKALTKIVKLLSKFRQQLVQNNAVKTDLKKDKLLVGLNSQFIYLINILDWLNERHNYESKFTNKKILFHGQNYCYIIPDI
ncbi:unnamed protein product [Paramecium sonneborni]|uniref:Uncharacterized protein n=1 Tax=Paramecium sonneborni TaxID=65129 RepID=A0A8S1RN24_9CILI|nr:unnamed protein product [Paramecium sonneborni]